MDFKQRILTTMNHEEPDRVPVMSLIIDQATADEVLGREPVDLIAVLKDPAQREPMIELLGGHDFWDDSYYGIVAGTMESGWKLGFDAGWALYTRMRLRPDPASSLGWVWHDVFGRVFELVPDGKGGASASYSRGLCGTEQKWERWIEDNAPMFERYVRNAPSFYKRLFDEYAGRIYPIGFAAPGIFENSWQPMGFVEFTSFVFEKPDFIRRVVAFYTELLLQHLEAVMQSGTEVILMGDDLGQKTGPMMRPKLIEDLFGEGYRRAAALVHSRNKKLIFHSCGNVYPLLDKFVDWGFDGLITLEPTAGMDLGKVRERVGHKLVLVGNLDVSHLLVHGTREEIDAAVIQAIRAAAPGGGYILSPSHSHAGVDSTRLQWMVEAAHEHGRYPIRV
jgi:hypothetical protein